jgi:hypothetical protein
MTDSTAFIYGFRVLGKAHNDRKIIDAEKAFNAHQRNEQIASNDQESYLSVFQFGVDFKHYLATNGSTKGYAGPTWARWIWFDIDREGNIESALADARRLVDSMSKRYQIQPRDLLIFFSGSKGFHVGLPTSIFDGVADRRFHDFARTFASVLAANACIMIDSSIYARVHLFRAPNSRHPTTGLHKRRLTDQEFAELTAAEIQVLASEPVSSELPESVKKNEQAVEDWKQAIQVATSTTVPTRGGPHPKAKLNQRTRNFISEGATKGERHRLLYSAARNLAEFMSVKQLAFALLTEPGRDSGLPPLEVARVINCGLKDGGAIHD